MKKIILLLLAGFLFVGTVQAQKKGESKIPETTTEIAVQMPTMSLMVEIKDSTGIKITVPILVVDRKGQLNEIEMKRLLQELKGNDPMRPTMKIVQMPEIDLRLFRLTEGIKESMMKVDSMTVLPISYMELNEAKRTRIN